MRGLFAFISAAGLISAPPGAGKSSLPKKVGGFELRVLDTPKPILFSVGREWIEASVPVYFYFPVGGADAIRALRKARDDLAALRRREASGGGDWDALLGDIDFALGKLEGGSPSRS